MQKMVDLKGYLLQQYECSQKPKCELWYSTTIPNLQLDRFLTFVVVQHHVMFKLRVFHLWQTTIASHEESHMGLNYSVNRC